MQNQKHLLAQLERGGFTLVELLIVISVIGILVGIALVVIRPDYIQGQGRDARRQSDIQSVRAALELYAVSQVDRLYPTGPYANLATPLADYLDGSLPQDPKVGWTAYAYSTNVGRTCFLLRATLEATGAGTYDVRGGKGAGCP